MRQQVWWVALGLWLAVTTAATATASGAPTGSTTAATAQAEEDDEIALWYAIGVGGDVSSVDDISLGGAVGQVSGFSYGGDATWVASGFLALDAPEDSTGEGLALDAPEDSTGEGLVLDAEPVPIVQFALLPIRPNPSRGVAYIGWTVPRAASVNVSVHDVQGRQVTTLADGVHTPGLYRVRWNGSTSSEGRAAGVYFIRLHTPEGDLVRRVVMVP